MLKKLQESKLLFWTLELLALTLLILVTMQLSFILEPLSKFIGSVFVPIVVSGFLYYLLNPLVSLLEKIPVGKKKMPRWVSIAIVMVGFLIILIMALINLLPDLISQVAHLAKGIPSLVSTVKDFIDDASQWQWVKQAGVQIDIEKMQSQLGSFGERFLKGTLDSMSGLISTITSITVTAVTVPVMTFYMLNDGHRLVPFLQKIFPTRQSGNVADILGRLNKTISQYISGQAIEMIFVGIFTSIGYFMIGQKYGLLLGVIAGITNIIPYVGPYIGIVPALFVAMMQSPMQIIWVIIVVLIVQQIDGNLVYPKIIGASLKIHPMTIIVLLLAAGNIAGIGGMILAIPTYAIVRTIVVYAWQLIHLKEEKLLEESKQN